jgi:glyoxylase-like metal-dependent hydrolase (beta-lactamase superfamily II)
MRNAFIFAAAFIAAAAPAAAQGQDFSKVEIKVERVAPGVAVLFGSGGNIGLSYGEDGNVLIDDQYAPLTDRILAAVRSVDPDPIRFVINTHWHADHTGGNERMGKAGAVIVAHDNVRRRMSTDQFMKAFNRTFPASPKEALPVVTFGQGVTLHVNGDTLEIIHVGRSHTDGDALVHWRKANVIHMGDTYFKDFSFPFIDTGSGGTLQGSIAALDTAMAMINDRTIVIPGHGPVATKADLVAYRAMIVDIRDQVSAGIKAGRTLAQIQAAKPAARYGMAEGFVKPAAFVALVYESLRNPPAAQKNSHGPKRHRH